MSEIQDSLVLLLLYVFSWTSGHFSSRVNIGKSLILFGSPAYQAVLQFAFQQITHNVK